MESKRYNLNVGDLEKLAKVALYSLGSAAAGILITLLAQVDLPPQYMLLGSLLNMLLVAGKKYFSGQDGVVGLKKE